MAEQYVVYVAAPGEEPSAEMRQRLAELLGLDMRKLESLLRRLPAEVTKPIPEATAVTVARRFREAGLQASIRAPGSLDAATAAPPAVGRPMSYDEQRAGPSENPLEHDRGDLGSGAQSADQVNIWKTQFGASQRAEPVEEEVSEDEEDELFPPSSFSPPAGPKAPSRGLLVALLLVVVVLVVLWYLF